MDKAALFEPRLPEAEIDTPAGVIKVRGLSRTEVYQLKRFTYGESDQLDARMLLLGVVEPKLTEAEVRKWRAAWTVDQLEPITDKIAELSGMPTSTEEPPSTEELEASFRGGSE